MVELPLVLSVENAETQTLYGLCVRLNLFSYDLSQTPP